MDGAKQEGNASTCVNQIGKLDRNTIEDKIIGYYADGKLSDVHHQLLKDKISKYYEKGSERYGVPFTWNDLKHAKSFDSIIKLTNIPVAILPRSKYYSMLASTRWLSCNCIGGLNNIKAVFTELYYLSLSGV